MGALDAFPQLDLVMMSTQLGLWDWNMKTGETVFDERWAQIIGYTLEQLQPTTVDTWVAHTHPDDLALALQQVDRYSAGQTDHYEAEMRMRHRDGHWVWIRDRGLIVERDAEGLALRMVGTHEDITARIEHQQELAESRKRYQGMFNDHDAVMLLIDPVSARVVEGNLASARFYGYDQQALRNLPLSKITLDQDLTLAAPGYHVTMTRLASGEIRMVDVHSSEISEDDHTLMFAVIRDVTAHLRGDLVELLSSTMADLVKATGATFDATVVAILRRTALTFGIDSAHILGEQQSWGWPQLGDCHAVGAGAWLEPGHPLTAQQLTHLSNLGVATEGSVLRLPFAVTEAERACAIFGTHQPRVWSGDDTDVLRLIADALGHALDRRTVMQRLERADMVFRNSHEAIVVLNAQRSIVEVNPAFSWLTGYSPAEAVGRPESILHSRRPAIPNHSSIWETVDAAGSWNGEMWVRTKDGRQLLARAAYFSVQNQDAHAAYVLVLDDITRLAQQAQQLQTLTAYDGLTGLPNRGHFTDLLRDHLLQGAAEGAVVLLDIDRLKAVNDAYGHAAGDHIISSLAARITQVLAPDCVLSRFAGNTFALLVPTGDGAGAVALVNHLNETVSAAVTVPGATPVYPTLCAGVCGISEDATHAEDILRDAAAALHTAKREGPASVRQHSGEHVQANRRRLTLESDLRRAWQRRELTLAYQPQFTIADMRLVGAEALLRWVRDGLPVAPAQFIAVAEETGLIRELGQWVLQQACTQAAAWAAAGTQLRIAVNVSALQLTDPAFPAHVEDALASSGLPAHLLELEMTESVLLMADTSARTSLDHLLDRVGVQLSVDDFGTGYSSFAMLKRLPLHKLKIDRSFIKDLAHSPDDQAITQAIIAMGHSLGLRVLAEGVETEDQRHLLQSFGCHEFQGFLITPPLPADLFWNRFAPAPLTARRP